MINRQCTCEAPTGTGKNRGRRLCHDPAETAMGDAHFSVCLRATASGRWKIEEPVESGDQGFKD